MTISWWGIYGPKTNLAVVAFDVIKSRSELTKRLQLLNMKIFAQMFHKEQYTKQTLEWLH